MENVYFFDVDQVQDLLNLLSVRDFLFVCWLRDKGFYVENLFFVECDLVDDLIVVLEEGMFILISQSFFMI